MNKLILVLFLAACLITAHAAMVKRDAPAETKPAFDITKELDGIKIKLEETFNPDKVKEAISKFGEQIQDGIKKLMPAETPKA